MSPTLMSERTALNIKTKIEVMTKVNFTVRRNKTGTEKISFNCEKVLQIISKVLAFILSSSISSQ